MVETLNAFCPSVCFLFYPSFPVVGAALHGYRLGIPPPPQLCGWLSLTEPRRPILFKKVLCLYLVFYACLFRFKMYIYYLIMSRGVACSYTMFRASAPWTAARLLSFIDKVQWHCARHMSVYGSGNIQLLHFIRANNLLNTVIVSTNEPG